MASAMALSDLPIGRLAPEELPDAEALAAEAGWNQVGADWRIFLERGTVYAVRSPSPAGKVGAGRREGTRVIATAATLPYGRCAWISMVLVTAAHRRRSLATRLLHRCIADITAAGLVPVLDATPAGRAVYAPLGFEEAWSFTRLTAQRRAALKPDDAVQPITDAAWPALCAYDADVFGADRSAVLARMRGRLPQVNLFTERAGRITGLLLGRDGRTAAHCSPPASRRSTGRSISISPMRRPRCAACSRRPASRRSARSPACCLAARRGSTTRAAPLR